MSSFHILLEFANPVNAECEMLQTNEYSLRVNFNEHRIYLSLLILRWFQSLGLVNDDGVGDDMLTETM